MSTTIYDTFVLSADVWSFIADYRPLLAEFRFFIVQDVAGMLIENSNNVVVEGQYDEGSLQGSIAVPKGGNQSANLVVAGTSSGVILKNINIYEGAGAASDGGMLLMHLHQSRAILHFVAICLA